MCLWVRRIEVTTHLGYTSQLCLRCRAVVKHRIVEFNQVRQNGKPMVHKICCSCNPEVGK